MIRLLVISHTQKDGNFLSDFWLIERKRKLFVSQWSEEVRILNGLFRVDAR